MAVLAVVEQQAPAGASAEPPGHLGPVQSRDFLAVNEGPVNRPEGNLVSAVGVGQRERKRKPQGWNAGLARATFEPDAFDVQIHFRVAGPQLVCEREVRIVNAHVHFDSRLIRTGKGPAQSHQGGTLGGSGVIDAPCRHVVRHLDRVLQCRSSRLRIDEQTAAALVQ